MASLTVDETTGARSFELPILGGLEGAPYQGPGLLRIEAENGKQPSQVVASFMPSELEFNFRLPKLVKHAPMPLDGPSLSLAASKAQAVVHFELPTAAVLALPTLPEALADLEGYLKQAPQLLAWDAYQIAGIGFQSFEEG